MADAAKPEDIETEQVERPKSTTIGKMLNRLRLERKLAVDGAKQKMLERHKVGIMDQSKYKFVEDRVTMPNGKEVIEVRLYQLIDGAAITINADVTSELEGGINHLREFNR